MWESRTSRCFKLCLAGIHRRLRPPTAARNSQFFCNVTCGTLAGNESHPSAADEDKGLTDSEGTPRPRKKKKAGELPKTFYFFPKVGDNDGWLTRRPASSESSGGAAPDYLQESGGNKAERSCIKGKQPACMATTQCKQAPHGMAAEKWRVGLNEATEPRQRN